MANNQSGQEKTTFSMAQAARRLGIARKELRRQVESGYVRVVRRNGKPHVTEEACATFLMVMNLRRQLRPLRY